MLQFYTWNGLQCERVKITWLRGPHLPRVTVWKEVHTDKRLMQKCKCNGKPPLSVSDSAASCIKRDGMIQSRLMQRWSRLPDLSGSWPESKMSESCKCTACSLLLGVDAFRSRYKQGKVALVNIASSKDEAALPPTPENNSACYSVNTKLYSQYMGTHVVPSAQPLQIRRYLSQTLCHMQRCRIWFQGCAKPLSVT